MTTEEYVPFSGCQCQ